MNVRDQDFRNIMPSNGQRYCSSYYFFSLSIVNQDPTALLNLNLNTSYFFNLLYLLISVNKVSRSTFDIIANMTVYEHFKEFYF